MSFIWLAAKAISCLFWYQPVKLNTPRQLTVLCPGLQEEVLLRHYRDAVTDRIYNVLEQYLFTIVQNMHHAESTKQLQRGKQNTTQDVFFHILCRKTD